MYVLSLGGTCSDGLKGCSMLFVSYRGGGVACYANCEGSSVIVSDSNSDIGVDVGSSCFIDGSSVVVHVNSDVDNRCLCGVCFIDVNVAMDVVGDQVDCSYDIKGYSTVVVVVAERINDEGRSFLMESWINGNNDTGSSSQLRYHGVSSVPSLEGVFSNRGSYHPNVSFHFNNKNVSKVMV
ncbi:hypothetical protein WA158_000674 [Blastocystis sp. Blastoise]